MASAIAGIKMKATAMSAHKICGFGAGAIGGFLAAELSLAGYHVCVIAHGSHLQAIRKNGLRLIIGGRESVAHIEASDRAEDFGPQDFVISR
jgi:2-dehydropantoate 2-reductase